MKKLILIFVTGLILVSCKKDNNSRPAGKENSFSFGLYLGFCGPTCAELFKIDDKKLYGDSVTVSVVEPPIFSVVPRPNADYLAAKILQDNFPAYLENNPDTTIGCPDCRDQGTIYIEKVTNGVTHRWLIDTDGTVLPAEIQPYIAQMQATLEDL